MGTFVLRRVEWRSALNVGMMLGVGFMMVNFMLVLAVISGGAGGWVNPEKYPSVSFCDTNQYFNSKLMYHQVTWAIALPHAIITNTLYSSC